MRIFALVIFAIVLGAGQASAWEEYRYLEQGVAIQFPARPQMTKATYDSILAKGLAATVYSAEDDHFIYKLAIVDLTSRAEAGANFLNDAAYGLIQKGDLIFADFTRVYFDERAVHGATVVVDRPDGATRSISTAAGFTLPRPWCARRQEYDNPVALRPTIRFPPDGRFD